ncbi:MAG: hypothetical protein AAF497_06905 [Planctomycetota bacterium]
MGFGLPSSIRLEIQLQPVSISPPKESKDVLAEGDLFCRFE